MRTKIFASLLLALAGGLFAATAVANVVIDPQGVFSTGVFPQLNANTRYRRFLAYRRTAADVDGLLFASSRGRAFDLVLLARRMGVRQVADFSVPFGMLTDHVAFLEYILRDKARRGERIKAVLLVIDADHFGKAPWTNVNIDSFLPPPVSGETAAYFWWRYLTAFQYRTWQASIAAKGRSDALSQSGGDREPVAPPATSRVRATTPRPDFAHQIALLQRFADLCRNDGVELTVATSPLSGANADALDRDELKSIVAQIGKVVPVWDFTAPSPLARRENLWLDASHYAEAVGTMMIDRMYLADSQGAFGRLSGGR